MKAPILNESNTHAPLIQGQAWYQFHQAIQDQIQVMILAFHPHDFIIEWQNAFAEKILGPLGAHQQLADPLVKLYQERQQSKSTFPENKTNELQIYASQNDAPLHLTIQWAIIPHPQDSKESLSLCLGYPLIGALQASQDLWNQLELYHRLTKREKEIFEYATSGHSTHEIAEMISRSRHTIESHRSNIIKKFKVKRLQDLIPLAVHLG
ncbi:MAG: helix-turn-helix transcriptional regulator, partial [Bacteroidota bacterium]